MSPDRLVIWANELLNALGMVAGLISGFQEGISRTSRTKTAGLTTEHAVLQVISSAESTAKVCHATVPKNQSSMPTSLTSSFAATSRCFSWSLNTSTTS